MSEDQKPKAVEEKSSVEEVVSPSFIAKSEEAVVEEKPAAPAPAPAKVETSSAPEAPAPKRKPAPAESSIASESVSASALVYRDRRRNSVSVGVLQDRLAELGFMDARTDIRGWFHDGTRKAVEEWQRANGVEPSGLCDSVTVERLFAGTPARVVA